MAWKKGRDRRARIRPSQAKLAQPGVKSCLQPSAGGPGFTTSVHTNVRSEYIGLSWAAALLRGEMYSKLLCRTQPEQGFSSSRPRPQKKEEKKVTYLTYSGERHGFE